MAHVTDRQLQEHLQGEMAAGEAEALAAHLRACAECRQRLGALEGVWGALGTWEAPAATGDMQARIMGALPARSVGKERGAWVRSMRVAAALVVAAGIGHGAGRMVWKPAASVPVDAEAAAMALHLDDPTTAAMLLAALDAPEGGGQ